MEKLNFKEWLRERGLLEEYVDSVAPTLNDDEDRLGLKYSPEEIWISGTGVGGGSSREVILKWLSASDDWKLTLKRGGYDGIEFGLAVSDELAMRLSAVEGLGDGSHCG